METQETLHMVGDSKGVTRVQEDGNSLWDGTVLEHCTKQVGFEPNLEESVEFT